VQTEQLGQAAERIYEWLKARDVVSRSSREDAEALASRIPPDLLSRLPSAERKHAVRDLASLYELADQPLKTFRVLINGYAVIDESEWQPYNERVWKALKPLPDDSLRNAASRASDANAQGWLELALSLRATDRFAIEPRAEAIRQWQQNWDTHPGARALPDELSIIATLPEQRPERIALTLPLSGSLSGPGKAVREGFLAAFYEDLGSIKPQKAIALTIHDTNKGGFSRIYADLLEADPDLVVGPCARNRSPASATRLECQYLSWRSIMRPSKAQCPSSFINSGSPARTKFARLQLVFTTKTIGMPWYSRLPATGEAAWSRPLSRPMKRMVHG